MKLNRKIIEIDEERCDGCGQCVLSCAEGAIEIIDGKAKLIKESYCDGLGACLGECPQGALRIIERESDEFDPEAVEHHLSEREKATKAKVIPMAAAGGCPSAQIRTFDVACDAANKPTSQSGGASSLAHWPVQIRLVPPNAPFLKGAHLLVTADCVPVAYPSFHQDFLAGKVVLLGCPKFDNVQEYVQKFAEIFAKSQVDAVTVLDMEVPCCSALPTIVKKGMELAGKTLPMETITISVQGRVVTRERQAV